MLGRGRVIPGDGNGAPLPGLARVPRRARPLDNGVLSVPDGGNKSEAADILTLALHRRNL